MTIEELGPEDLGKKKPSKYASPVVDTSCRLELRNLICGYGRKRVVRGISLTVGSGEIVSVIGPNGAGKSTLLKAIAGLLPVESGSILLDGHEIHSLPSHRRASKGISYCMQDARVFPTLTVQENLDVALVPVKKAWQAERLGLVFDVFPELKDILRTRAGLLSGGLRHLLAISLTLVQQPTVLLLDEPSAGLAPGLAKTAFEKVRTWNHERGTSIILVEQNVRDSLAIAHRAIVLVEGSIAINTGNPIELQYGDQLERLFLGNNE